ncbi:MAG: hypothetical protein LAP21_01485 [Acidobacteriia bacterium]|nr:hypothetical protein [Terriglobia bacterium]
MDRAPTSKQRNPAPTIRNHDRRDGAPHRLWLCASRRKAKALDGVNDNQSVTGLFATGHQNFKFIVQIVKVF